MTDRKVSVRLPNAPAQYSATEEAGFRRSLAHAIQDAVTKATQIDIDGLVALGSPDGADYVLVYDVSAGVNRKVTLTALGGGTHTHTASQITDFATAVETNVEAGNYDITGSWTFTTVSVPAATVTAHQAALTILESQITDGTILARIASAETITGTWVFAGAGGAADAAVAVRPSGTGAGYFRVYSDPGVVAGFEIRDDTSGTQRWLIYKAVAETGSNAGSDLYIASYSDAGSYLGSALKITRSNFYARFYGNLGIGIDASGSFSLNLAGAGYSATHWRAPEGLWAGDFATTLAHSSPRIWGTYWATGGVAAGGPSDYFFLLNAGDQRRGIQLSANFGSDNNGFHIRRGSDNASSENGANVWQAWKKLVTTANLETELEALTGPIALTARLGLPDGAVGTPSLHLNNSTTTGFYRFAADDIGVAIAGVRHLNFNAVGLQLYNAQIHQDGYYDNGTIASGGTLNVNWNGGNSQKCAVNLGNITINVDQTSAKVGTSYTMKVRNISASARTVTWSGVDKWVGSAPTASMTAGYQTTVQLFIDEDGTGARYIIGSVILDNTVVPV